MPQDDFGYDLKGHAVAAGERGRVSPQVVGIQLDADLFA